MFGPNFILMPLMFRGEGGKGLLIRCWHYIGIVKQNKEMLIDDMKLLIRYEKKKYISNIDGLVVMIMVKNCK